MLFTTALFVSSAVLACWIGVRFPRLAPASPTLPMVGAGVLLALISAAPVFDGNSLTLYASVFGVLLPLLTAMWLCTVWLLQVARDAVGARR